MKHSKLIALGASFLFLAVAYSLVIPIFEGPDEDDHFRFAKYIADHRALPVQVFEPGGGEAGHQGWQPPLYYSFAAALLAPMDTSDFAQHLWRNPAATFVGDAACCGRNIYYHTDSENFPFHGTTLAVHWVRLFSALFGLIAVAATYALTLTLFPKELWLALAAAAVVAFNPSYLFASALVSNDAPLAALSALVLLGWVKFLTGQWNLSLRYPVLLGGLIGLALLVKTTAIGLIPFSILVLGIIGWRQQNLRHALTAGVTLLAVVAIVSGWWLVRNQLLYGDPLALRLMQASALFPRSGPLTLPELFQISLPWLWQTFWGGPTPGDFSPLVLVILAILSAFGAFGFVLAFFRIRDFEFRISVAVLGLWLAFIFVAQIQFIRTTVGADQGRYLFPAISAFALFFAVGLRELGLGVLGLFPKRLRLPPFGSMALWPIGLFALFPVFVLFAYTRPAYARPALLSENDLSRIAHRVQINFLDQIELRGYEVDTRTVKPGDALVLSLYWRALAPMAQSYRVFVHLVGLNDRTAGGVDVIPGRGAFPTVYWKPGDILRDRIEIPVPPSAVPGQYAIEVGLYPVGNPGDRLNVVGSGDDRLILDKVKVAPREKYAYVPQVALNANFGDQALLTGYDLQSNPGEVTLTLYWQALATFDRDYQVFAHLVDRDGRIVDQVDRPPQQGNYPTLIWTPGEQIPDVYTLALPLDRTPGNYRVELGLYRPDTLERLPVRIDGRESDHVEIMLPAVP